MWVVILKALEIGGLPVIIIGAIVGLFFIYSKFLAPLFAKNKATKELQEHLALEAKQNIEGILSRLDAHTSRLTELETKLATLSSSVDARIAALEEVQNGISEMIKAIHDDTKTLHEYIRDRLDKIDDRFFVIAQKR